MSADGELLQAWATGNERAGYDLYKRHAGAVVRFFRNKVDDRDVDDLLQSTFMRCLEHRTRYQRGMVIESTRTTARSPRSRISARARLPHRPSSLPTGFRQRGPVVEPTNCPPPFSTG